MADETAMPNVACPQYEPLLEDHLNLSLGAADAKRAEDHLKACNGCREAFQNARHGARLFRAAAPEPLVPGAGFSRIVMARISAAESDLNAERAGFWQSLVTLGWRFAASAAFALALLVAYDAGHTWRAQPAQHAVRHIQATDFFFASDPAQPPANRDETLMMVAETGHGNH